MTYEEIGPTNKSDLRTVIVKIVNLFRQVEIEVIVEYPGNEIYR